MTFIVFIGLASQKEKRKTVAPQSELRRLGGFELKLQLVRNQGDELRIRGLGYQRRIFTVLLVIQQYIESHTLPTTGRVRDFHPLDSAHAGRTKTTHNAYELCVVFLS